MDEPPQDRSDPRRTILPAVIAALTATFLLALLLESWQWPRGSKVPHIVVVVYLYSVILATGAYLLVMLFSVRGPAIAGELEAWLCQHCLKPYVPGAHFCPRCGAPKTFYSGTAPYERVYAQAWLLGKAARHPSRRLHLVGLWLVALGPLAGLWHYCADLSAARWVKGSWLDLVLLGIWLLYASLFLAVLVMGLSRWWRRERGEEPKELEMDYGAPPYFTHDVEWGLPEYEVETDEEPPPPPAQDPG